MNRSAVPAAISVIGTCGVRLIYVLALFPMFRSPQTLMYVYPISWIITGSAMTVAYFITRKRAFTEAELSAAVN